MDFGYKVIRNRLGSLVANAIQKKIDSNKGSKMFVVNITGNAVQGFSTTIDSSEVIEKYNKGQLIVYKLTATDTQSFVSPVVSVLGEVVQVFMTEGVGLQHSGTTISLA